MEEKGVSDIIGTIVMVLIIFILIFYVSTFIFIQQADEEPNADLEYNQISNDTVEIKAIDTYNSEVVYIRGGTPDGQITSSGDKITVQDDGSEQIRVIGQTSRGTETVLELYSFS